MPELRRVKTEIRSQFVNAPAGSKNLVKTFSRVLGLKERAPVAAGRSLEEDVRVGVQPSHNPNPMKSRAVSFSQYRSPASCQNHAGNTHEIGQHSRLGFPEYFLPILGKYICNAAVFGLGDQLVAIQKPMAGKAGKPSANG